MIQAVTLLGTKGGPAVRQGGSMPTASLLEMAGQKILVDCAIGVTRSLVEAGHSLLDIRTIFITHLHSDHILELGPLIYTAWTSGLSAPIKIFGPRGIEAYWQSFLKAMEFDAAIRVEDEGRQPIAELVTVQTIGEDERFALGDLTVSTLRVKHPPVTDCFALRFAGPGTAVFSADTTYFPPLADFAQGADLLVHEALHLRGLDTLIARTPNTDDRLRQHLLASHTVAEDVGRIAKAAQVGQLALNHLVPADDPEITGDDWLGAVREHWSGPVVVGTDGLVIPF